MSLNQIHNMEMVLEWVKACPFPYHVSSYQGGKIAVRVTVPNMVVRRWRTYETEQPKNRVDLNLTHETDVEQESDIHSDSAWAFKDPFFEPLRLRRAKTYTTQSTILLRLTPQR